MALTLTPLTAMLLSKQITGVPGHAPEKLLLKVLQQIRERAEPSPMSSPTEEEDDSNGTSGGLRKQFRCLRQELFETDREGLVELQELWTKKMTELEKLITRGGSGGRETTQKIEKQMKILDAMLSAKLLALDVESDSIKEELSTLREEMMETNESRLRGEPAAAGKLKSLVEEMKSFRIS
jgi:hypothetical protein